MALSAISWSILIQLTLFLVVRSWMFFPRFDLVNWLYIGTIGEFIEDLSLGTVWIVTFHKWLPGQFFVFSGLTFLLAYSLFLARRKDLRLKALLLFHITAVMWIFLPVVALEIGTYSGP
jgi:hypothetical protein